MNTYHYDLHIHSCLSPCGDNDMTPNNLVQMALLSGCDVIALTDHNTCRNAPAAMEAGARNGLLVIPGMELCTAEEAHVACSKPWRAPWSSTTISMRICPTSRTARRFSGSSASWTGRMRRWGRRRTCCWCPPL